MKASIGGRRAELEAVVVADAAERAEGGAVARVIPSSFPVEASGGLILALLPCVAALETLSASAHKVL